jgi:hypothetical protein
VNVGGIFLKLLCLDFPVKFPREITKNIVGRVQYFP